MTNFVRNRLALEPNIQRKLLFQAGDTFINKLTYCLKLEEKLTKFENRLRKQPNGVSYKCCCIHLLLPSIGFIYDWPQ